MRHKITITEVLDPSKLVYDENEKARAVASVVVFEQAFDDLDLRNFVRQLNATPRRRRKATTPKAE